MSLFVGMYKFFKIFSLALVGLVIRRLSGTWISAFVWFVGWWVILQLLDGTSYKSRLIGIVVKVVCFGRHPP